MLTTPQTVDIPNKPAERRAWVKYQLSLKGISFAEIARQEGVARVALSQVFMTPSSHLEEVIAKALGMRVMDLFPERFSQDGQRLHVTRPQYRTTKRDSSPVKNERAA